MFWEDGEYYATKGFIVSTQLLNTCSVVESKKRGWETRLKC
jgi:hypothetical protein